MLEFIKSNKAASFILVIILIYVILYDLWDDLHLNHDFLLGVWVEFHGVVIEVVLIVLGLGLWNARQESIKWRPARLAVAQKIISLHTELFYSLKWVIDVDCTKSFIMPYDPNTRLTRNQWDLECRKKHLKNSQNKLVDLEKMVQFSNAFLGNESLLTTIEYMEHARHLQGLMIFLIHIRETQETQKALECSGEHPLDMEVVHYMFDVINKITEQFPDIDFNAESSVSAQDIVKVIQISNKEKDDLTIRIKNNN